MTHLETRHIFTDAQRDEIKLIMNEALKDFFSDKGTMTKNILVSVATIFGALVVIGGGLKVILGWIGFNYISK